MPKFQERLPVWRRAPEAKKFVCECLRADPLKRSSAHQLAAHKWFGRDTRPPAAAPSPAATAAGAGRAEPTVAQASATPLRPLNRGEAGAVESGAPSEHSS